jgi:hypothetical protein
MLRALLRHSEWFDDNGFASLDAWRMFGIVFVALATIIVVASFLDVSVLALAAAGLLVLFTIVCPLLLTLREPWT